MGISAHFFNALYQCVVNIMVFIRIDHYLKDKLPQKVGVPQDDRLAPLFFTVFNTNLDLVVRKTEVLVVFYTDDFALGHRPVKTTTSNVNFGENLRKH